MIFMGVLFRKEQEEEILLHSTNGISNASNTFQWNMIDGIRENIGQNLHIVNALPVGTWPTFYQKLFLDTKEWSFNDRSCYELGGLNLPFFKQFVRYKKACKVLKRLIKNENEKEIIIYSAYMPFLKAVYKLPSRIKVSVIVTDLPEYYDLSCVSAIRKKLRSWQNKMIAKYMTRIDSFVLLTEQMKEPLRIGDRPYTVVEGICNIDCANASCADVVSSDEKIILYTGTLHKIFGIANLVEAFMKIDDPSYRLWICGSGDMQQEVERATQKDSRIVFWGYVSKQKINELQEKATVLVNPRQNNEEYTKYSFPSKTMEYMMSGKPVVMYKLDGVPKDYEDYLCYVSGDTINDLRDKLVEVCSMPISDRERIGKQAKVFVSSHKNSKYQARKVLELFNQ